MSSFLFWHRTNYSALSVAGASSAGAAAAASSACLAASAAANSAFFLATISAFALLASFSASRRALAFCSSCFAVFFFDSLYGSLFVLQPSLNFSSAAASSNAPFLTPSNKCFFKQTPSRERMLRVVSGVEHLLVTNTKALSKFKSTVAGLVFGL